MNKPIFWLVIGFSLVVTLTALLVRNKGLQAKKRYVIGVIISINVLIMVFLISLRADLQLIMVFAVVLFLFTLIAVKSIRVCEACGQEIYFKMPFDSNKYCINCNMGVKRGKQYHDKV